MNIFALDEDPVVAARCHVDSHVVKMPLEAAQLLCSAHYFECNQPVRPEYDVPYKLSHASHPCAFWVRYSLDNYMWLVAHGLALCAEFAYRRGKLHSCLPVIQWASTNHPVLREIGLTPWLKAMPDEYKVGDPVESYRAYYNEHKRPLFLKATRAFGLAPHKWCWTGRTPPDWAVEPHYQEK